MAALDHVSEARLERSRGNAAPTGLRAWFVPSLMDVWFVALFVWMLAGAGPSALLIDGDVGWHIRTGEWILEHRAVPQTDLFTFTKPGAPWFAWEWLSDVALALLHGWMGLKGVVLLAAAVLAAWPVVVLRHALWRGANMWLAVLFALLAVGASSIHYLARPHVFTLLFTAIAAWLIDADLRRPSRRVLWLIPLTLVWTNLHGGFGLAVMLSALTGVGCAVEAWFGGGWRRCGRYGALAAGCGLASLANPYGFQLHAHIVAYLRSDWIRQVVDEFKAPDFRSESLFQFEIVAIAALILTGLLVREKKFVPALWIVAFTHLSLTSVRHVPVFMIVAAPIAAAAATRVWSEFAARADRRSVAGIVERIGADARAGFLRFSVWPFIAVTAVATSGAVQWPLDFPKDRFPIEIMRGNAEMLARGRVMTVDQWADYLIYANYPRQRVFADGRSDFLGPALGGEYLRAMQGNEGWHDTLDRYSVDTVLAPAKGPLASLLRITPAWRAIAGDDRATLFTRTLPGPHLP